MAGVVEIADEGHAISGLSNELSGRSGVAYLTHRHFLGEFRGWANRPV